MNNRDRSDAALSRNPGYPPGTSSRQIACSSIPDEDEKAREEDEREEEDYERFDGME